MDTASEVIHRCRLLAECTEEPGHITRTFLSSPMRDVHAMVRAWMEDAGLEVRVDAVGNIRGTIGPAPRIMIGSHLDTVPHAGAFDGILGVMMGIALSRCGRAMEVVGFSEEEGVRFGIPFIGSRALVGDPVMDAGVLDAVRAYGLDPAELPGAMIGDEVSAYLEFHIEQGPVLEQMGLPVAVVDAISGQSRYDVTFRGRANHAGTTPMFGRSDALAAAAEWILEVEKLSRDTPHLTATVGRLEVEPNATNVIAGEVRASLDVRSGSDSVRAAAAGRMLAATSRRLMSVSYRQRMDQAAVPMNAQLVEKLGQFTPHRMSSGAGHDAMILARKVPAVMLFLRSPGGISHHPDENVLVSDVAAALAAGKQFLEAL